MGSTIFLLVLLSISVFVVRLASVVFRLTGMDEPKARFQALSAYTGTGFSTAESEEVVNHPVRRRVVTLLMLVGNLGLVSVLATMVVSFSASDPDAVLHQLFWFGGGLTLFWGVMLNPVSDRLMCAAMARLLRATTKLDSTGYDRMLQIGANMMVYEAPVGSLKDYDGQRAIERIPLAVRKDDGPVVRYQPDATLQRGDSIIWFAHINDIESHGTS